MPDPQPGTRVLYRDGDRYLVARIDLVKDGYYTAFPFDPLHRRWLKTCKRIARDFVLAHLPDTADAAEIATHIEVLRNQREAKRQQANRWLHQRVYELAQQDQPA